MKIDDTTAEKLRPWFPGLDMGSVTLVHSGPVCWFVRSVIRQGAMTVAPYVFYGKSSFDPARARSLALLAHELKHVEQYRERGLAGFLVKYLLDKPETASSTVRRCLWSRKPTRCSAKLRKS